jgi:hypothetical protein
MRWAGHVTYMGERRGAYRVKETAHLEDPSIDERIILRWILRQWNEEAWNWNHLAQNRNRSWASINVVMNLWVP